MNTTNKNTKMKTPLEEIIKRINDAIDNNVMVGSIIYPTVEIAFLELKQHAEKLLILERQLSKDCFVEKVILKDGYRACCGKEMTDDAAEKYCKDVWLKS